MRYPTPSVSAAVPPSSSLRQGAVLHAVRRKSAPLAATPSGRLSYARIAEVRDGVSVDKFEVPNLIELQLESFQWFIEKGLRDLFDEISPIKDFTGKVMELQFLDYEFGTPEVLRGGVPDEGPHVQPAAVRERRAPDQGDRRDPAPARVHGRLPVDDGHGHVRHQRRRARRRLPARALAGRLLTASSRIPATGRMLFTAKVIPNRGAWLEFETSNKDSAVGQGRPQAQDRRSTTLLRAIGYETNDEIAGAVRRGRHRPRAPVHRSDPRQGPHQDAGRGADRGLQEAAPGRSADRRQRPPAGREPVLQLPALRPRPRRPLQVQQEAGRGRRADGHRAPARGAARSPARTSRRSSAT